MRRGGYTLIYTDTPSDYQKSADGQLKRVDLLYSVGVQIDAKDKPGTLLQVQWDSPAFKAKLAEGAQILAVNGFAYGENVLKEAIRATAGTNAPIESIVKSGDRFFVARLDYHDGLRYPHLERDVSEPPRLDAILAARP